MREFNDWINFHDLVDFPLTVAKYMWSNLQGNPLMSRLDCFLVSSSRLDLFSDCIQRALA